MVSVLENGKTHDKTFAAIARNIMMLIAKLDIDFVCIHILGKNNVIADGLSRWSLGNLYRNKVLHNLRDPVWFYPQFSIVDLDWSI